MSYVHGDTLEYLLLNSKMSDLDKLATQLLGLSKQLAMSNKSFNLTLKTKDIDFTFSTQDRKVPPRSVVKKKKSQSQKKIVTSSEGKLSC